MFKTIINKPPFITISEIDNWSQSFFNFIIKNKILDSIDSREKDIFLNSLILEFSDEIPPKEFIDEKDAIYELKSLYGLLNNSNFNNASLNDIKRYIYKISEERNFQIKFNKSCSEIRNEVDDIINSTSQSSGRKSSYTLGCYLYTKKIVLYNASIKDESVDSRNNLNQTYLKVFVHELFHALHHFLCKKFAGNVVEIQLRKDFTSTVVKESLASFIEHYYCIEHSIVSTNEDDWKKNKISNFPYAGARYIPFISNFLRLKEIITLSYKDFDLALRKLLQDEVDPNVFYSVKNKEIKYKIYKQNKINKKDDFYFKYIQARGWAGIGYIITKRDNYGDINCIEINNNKCLITYHGLLFNESPRNTRSFIIEENKYKMLMDFFDNNYLNLNRFTNSALNNQKNSSFVAFNPSMIDQSYASSDYYQFKFKDIFNKGCDCLFDINSLSYQRRIDLKTELDKILEIIYK